MATNGSSPTQPHDVLAHERWCRAGKRLSCRVVRESHSHKYEMICEMFGVELVVGSEDSAGVFTRLGRSELGQNSSSCT